jgi:signal transduction histidine kinase
MKGTKKYGNKIFIITENQSNALREEINMADYKEPGNRCGGIPEEHISKIFERFYQTDNSSSFTLGTGIGLALAKGIMNMHHGKIDVESTV